MNHLPSSRTTIALAIASLCTFGQISIAFAQQEQTESEKLEAAKKKSEEATAPKSAVEGRRRAMQNNAVNT